MNREMIWNTKEVRKGTNNVKIYLVRNLAVELGGGESSSRLVQTTAQLIRLSV
jgi:hypothetical protein